MTSRANSPFRPLRAPSQSIRPDDLVRLQGHYLGSPKIDGIRCIIMNGMPMSRSLKPIRNKFIQRQLQGIPYPLDGELLLRYRGEPISFNDVTSAVMSAEGTPDFIFWVFDVVDPIAPFSERLRKATQLVKKMNNPHVHLLEHVPMCGGREAHGLYQRFDADGYEGMMIRRAHGLYKFGQATPKQDIIHKVKDAERDEGVVIGFEEELQNTNAAKKNALGLTERSTARAGKVGKGFLGKLVVTWQGREIRVSGFSEDLAKEVWKKQGEYLGKLVTFEFQEYTADGAPRFPQFKGFRDSSDLG